MFYVLRGLFWRKLMFPSLFIYVLVNTALISIDFKHNSSIYTKWYSKKAVLQKINVSFIVHVSLGKYSFYLNPFFLSRKVLEILILNKETVYQGRELLVTVNHKLICLKQFKDFVNANKFTFKHWLNELEGWMKYKRGWFNSFIYFHCDFG